MQYVSTLLIIVAVGIVIRLLFAAGRKKPVVREDGSIDLRMPAGVAVVGCVAIAFGALIGIVTAFDLVETTGDEVVPYLVAFFVALGLPLILVTLGVRVSVSDREILRTGLTGRTRQIRWDEVRKVAFSSTAVLVVHADGTRIRMHSMLVGFEDLLDMVKRKLEPSTYGKAVNDYEAYARNLKRRGFR